jgi:hypothetical protein
MERFSLCAESASILQQTEMGQETRMNDPLAEIEKTFQEPEPNEGLQKRALELLKMQDRHNGRPRDLEIAEDIGVSIEWVDRFAEGKGRLAEWPPIVEPDDLEVVSRFERAQGHGNAWTTEEDIFLVVNSRFYQPSKIAVEGLGRKSHAGFARLSRLRKIKPLLVEHYQTRMPRPRVNPEDFIRWRHILRLNRTEVAEMYGRAVTAVRQWESGATRIPRAAGDHLRKWAEFMEANPPPNLAPDPVRSARGKEIWAERVATGRVPKARIQRRVKIEAEQERA